MILWGKAPPKSGIKLQIIFECVGEKLARCSSYSVLLSPSVCKGQIYTVGGGRRDS